MGTSRSASGPLNSTSSSWSVRLSSFCQYRSDLKQNVIFYSKQKNEISESFGRIWYRIRKLLISHSSCQLFDVHFQLFPMLLCTENSINFHSKFDEEIDDFWGDVLVRCTWVQVYWFFFLEKVILWWWWGIWLVRILFRIMPPLTLVWICSFHKQYKIIVKMIFAGLQW